MRSSMREVGSKQVRFIEFLEGSYCDALPAMASEALSSAKPPAREAASEEDSMKIVRIDSYHTPWVCFVKVTAEDGSVGWGQTSPFAADMTADLLHRLVAVIRIV